MKISAVLKSTLLTLVLFHTYSVGKENSTNNKRWYSKQQVESGKEIFIKNCAICHGKQAEKTIHWKKTLSDGSYPAPPLNGTAHAWHHPKSQLKRIIAKGGKPYDGKMPAFQSHLSNSDMDKVIAYFQSFWKDKEYNMWHKNGGLSR